MNIQQKIALTILQMRHSFFIFIITFCGADLFTQTKTINVEYNDKHCTVELDAQELKHYNKIGNSVKYQFKKNLPYIIEKNPSDYFKILLTQDNDNFAKLLQEDTFENYSAFESLRKDSNKHTLDDVFALVRFIILVKNLPTDKKNPPFNNLIKFLAKHFVAYIRNQTGRNNSYAIYGSVISSIDAQFVVYENKNKMEQMFAEAIAENIGISFTAKEVNFSLFEFLNLGSIRSQLDKNFKNENVQKPSFHPNAVHNQATKSYQERISELKTTILEKLYELKALLTPSAFGVFLMQIFEIFIPKNSKE